MTFSLARVDEKEAGEVVLKHCTVDFKTWTCSPKFNCRIKLFPSGGFPGSALSYKMFGNVN